MRFLRPSNLKRCRSISTTTKQHVENQHNTPYFFPTHTLIFSFLCCSFKAENLLKKVKEGIFTNKNSF